jgi:hypothetical protein
MKIGDIVQYKKPQIDRYKVLEILDDCVRIESILSFPHLPVCIEEIDNLEIVNSSPVVNKPKNKERFYFFDRNGYEWVWISNETRVVLNVQSELDDPQSGYPAFSLEEAVKYIHENY